MALVRSILFNLLFYPGTAVHVLGVIAVLRWLSETDLPVPESEVDIGAGIRVPTYVTGPQSHGWWAMVILIVVLGMVFAMALFSLAFLWGNQPAFWTAPPSLVAGLPIASGYLAVILAALVTRRLHRREHSWATVPVLLAASALPALTWIDWRAWTAVLAPAASGQSAAAFAILALQASVGAIALLMALYLGWRVLRRLVTPLRNNTLDLTCLFVGYAGAQGLAGTVFARAIGA